MRRGQRTIDGRVYVLGGRTTGLNAKAVAVAEAAVRVVCFGRNKNGSPVHPLYQRTDAPLLPFFAPKI